MSLKAPIRGVCPPSPSLLWSWLPPIDAIGAKAKSGVQRLCAPTPKPHKRCWGRQGASGGWDWALAWRRQPLGCKGWEKGKQFLPAARMPW